MEDKEKSVDKSIDERVHQQLVYKDNRIIDLNNVILDKERQILDLQERVREHNEVATVKNQAMRIVQQKFEELQRDKKDMSTETEPGLMAYSAQGPSTSGSSTKSERRTRSSSPGHVIAARKSTSFPSSGTFSPPPVDPPVESTSFSSKLGPNLPDIDGIHRKHHQRKRVTFDLNPNAPRLAAPSAPESLESALTEASSENALLRQQVIDLNAAVEKMKADYEMEIVKCTKEAKTAGLKAKVAATARIKELEATLEGINQKYEDETDCLREEVATLRSSRNWEIEQNGQLREQIAHLKEKSHKLNEELDASEKAKRELDKEVEEAKTQIELMVDDLLQAEHVVNYHINQKEAIFQDVDRLKDAINAQDRFIEILEADIVIYEQHIGLLRENLGASKVDHRALIKSKAFETKLHALEREKEQIDKKSSEERLKTKALDKKCRVLVEQNEQLMARLCELEMNSSSSHPPPQSSSEQQLAEHVEHIRQITLALESERDVSQKLREAKESVERELMAVRRQEEASQNRARHDVEIGRMEAQNKVEEMTVEVEAAHKKISDVMAELEQLRATNFDLQMHIETAKRTMEELADSNEELEDRVKEVEEECEEKSDDLKQSTWDVEQLTRQNEAMRVELDGIRQGFQETRELSEEVRQLKLELAKQQELQKAQFDAECERLRKEEAGEVPERKTSLEVQQEQYILAFELKVAQLNKELEETKAQREQLRAQLESTAPVQRKTTSVLEAPDLEQIVQKQEVQMVSAIAPETPNALDTAELQQLRQQNASLLQQIQTLSSIAPLESPELQQLRQQNQDLFEKLQRSEMEATLSGELNVELGRAMLELEEQNELLKKNQQTVSQEEAATGRELELHIMMVNEMTDQIELLQTRIDEIQAKKEEQTQEMNKWRTEAAAASHENKRLTEEVQRLLHNLAEFEIARKKDLEKATNAHDAEIRKFSIKMEDARREIADLEVRLQESTQKLLKSELKASELVAVQETQILTSSTPASDAPEIPEASELPQTHQEVPVDISMLAELKEELQTAVEALKAEIWSLNGQLKASILDREGLEDRLAVSDSLLEKEKKRAIALDVELQEQIDLTDRAVRRAAEAENESNQRMAECLEKETRREEIEKAYTRLNEYYQQLQEAYNNVYAQLAAAEAQGSAEAPTIESTPSYESPAISQIVDGIMTILLISRDPSISLSTQQKLEKIGDKIKTLLSEYDENQKALEEQRRISDALQARLQTLELESSRAAASGEVTTTRERVEQLEGEIEWKEEECEGLKRRVRELERALEAVAERADESEAARLTTRQADVDSLFRTNAELAHTNVRLQNEIDEADEWKLKAEEEKQLLEENVKQLEEQVAELMQQHEEHLQRAQQVQIAPDHSVELQEMQNEVQRLASIERTLNNRILALEDQNMELEEKVQEMESELMDMKNQSTSEQKEPKKTSSDDWDSWDTEEKPTQEDSEEVKALTMHLEVLQMQNKQLQTQLEEQKNQKTHEAVKEEREEDEDDWGWGEEKQETTEVQKTPAASSNLELLHAKSEVERLGNIEKVLNNRILALEDQNLELEERLQEMEEELNEEKKKKVEEEKKEDDWGGWNEEEEKKEDVDDGQLQNTIAELQDRLKFQKEVIEKVEAELIEQQDKYDELDEVFRMTQEELKKARQPNESEQLAEKLRTLEAQFEAARRERDVLREKLNEKEAELDALEARVDELEVERENKEETDGWNEDGWGASENNTEELAELKQKNAELEKEVDEEKEKIRLLEEARSQAESNLKKSQQELEDVKAALAQKEAELAEAEASSGWNDDEWKDDTEAEKLKQTNKLLEMRVEVMRTELQSVREREQELSDLNEQLKNHLELSVRELGEAKQKLAASGNGGWNDQGRNDAADEEKTILELELKKKNELIAELREQVIELQREAINASEAADLQTLEELLKMREQLRVVQEQNGLLKDSEARLLDHADEFAVQMEQYREKCTVSTSRIAELEQKLQSATTADQQLKLYSDELVTLRQQLANAEQEKRVRNATISDREGLILELRRQLAEHTKTIEELKLKVKTLATARRAQLSSGQKVPSTSQSSRPPSQMSTSSRLSTSSSFVPEAVAVPIQSMGSAFDVVVPQNTGEPLRRRNK